MEKLILLIAISVLYAAPIYDDEIQKIKVTIIFITNEMKNIRIPAVQEKMETNDDTE